MRSLFSTAVLGVCILLAVPEGWCKANHQLKHGVADAFKIFRDFDYGVGILDIDQDGKLDCVTARRTEFDKNGPSATYVWILPGPNGKEKKNVTLHIRAGSAPNKPVFTVGDGGAPEQAANFIYADYKTCSVFELPFDGVQECMLWTSKESKDDVPQHCVEQFEDNCDLKNAAYDKDTCSQFEDDS
ncbi:uncharacterized protein LOC144125557 isoform X2 [Amblyomma americanum]